MLITVRNTISHHVSPGSEIKFLQWEMDWKTESFQSIFQLQAVREKQMLLRQIECLFIKDTKLPLEFFALCHMHHVFAIML